MNLTQSIKKLLKYSGLLLILFIGCTSLKHTKPSDIVFTKPEDKTFRFMVGDRIAIKLYRHRELNELVTVRPDGYISLQLIDDVLAVGKTPAELDNYITIKYATILQKPEVSVIVHDIGPRLIYVGGEVARPGVIELPRTMTCLQALFAAGGFLPSAELTTVIILRETEEIKPQFIVINLKDDLQNTWVDNNIRLQAQDIIFVPRNAIASLNLFVDQYIEQVLPIQASVGVSYSLTQ